MPGLTSPIQSCENVRQTIELCDVGREIQTYVQRDGGAGFITGENLRLMGNRHFLANALILPLVQNHLTSWTSQTVIRVKLHQLPIQPISKDLQRRLK